MMDCTDRHFRYLARLISRHTYLYSEMVTVGAVIHGCRERLLGFHPAESPVALQLGGSDPLLLSQCSKIAEDWGYDEVNLNVGCPSARVQSGMFGACLMKEPELVARCFEAMQSAVSVPVTIKTRIGVDEQDSYEALHHFVSMLANAGCQVLIVHARKAWLNGLSPRENREIPPLNYDVVYQLKSDFPAMEIIINGGIKTLDAALDQLTSVDGIMLGREAYANPYLLSSVDSLLYGVQAPIQSRRAIVNAYLPYILEQHAAGVPLRHMVRHLIGLYQGVPGAKRWRRFLSENVSTMPPLPLMENALSLVGPA